MPADEYIDIERQEQRSDCGSGKGTFLFCFSTDKHPEPSL
jgi:hypothetical protein